MASEPYVFAGRVALVTGAGAGIGEACVRELAGRGAAVAATVEALGGLDVLVSNAGIQHDGTVLTLDEDEW